MNQKKSPPRMLESEATVDNRYQTDLILQTPKDITANLNLPHIDSLD